MKFCKDCAYCNSKFINNELYRCKRVTNVLKGSDYAVTGKTTMIVGFCNIERKEYGTCGPQAKWFVERESLLTKIIGWWKGRSSCKN